MENRNTAIASPDDEAGVRLVDDKNGLKTANDKNIEIKYFTPDSKNGDAKIDIENLKIAFAGMGKEELMKYANDPFWVKMRWFLFILFWLVWIAMLAGAIAIVIVFPKCSAPSPIEWWEESPMYHIDVRSFKDGGEQQDGIGDLQGVESKLSYLKEIGIKTVVLSNILKSSKVNASPDKDSFDNGNTVDFKEIDEKVGTLQQFKNLAIKMKDLGLYLVLSFIPNHSSDKHPWFLKSVEGEEPYKDYYVWANNSGYKEDDNTTPLPPNNWISVNGGSAWEWNEKRKMFYLHQFNKSQPDFNFYNEKVVNEFNDVLKFWLENGVHGFNLEKIQYLLEDKELRSESISSNPGEIHNNYGFLNHKMTTNVDGLSKLLNQWSKLCANSSGILFVTSSYPILGVQSSAVSSTNEGSTENGGKQMIVRPQVLNSLTADSLLNTVKYTMKQTAWPTWMFSCKSESTDSKLLSGLVLVSLLLPGTPVIKSGSELGLTKNNLMSWDNSTNGGFSTSDNTWRRDSNDYSKFNVAAQLANKNSILNQFKKLVSIRNSPAIMYGATDVQVVNGTVFVFTRIKSGNPGYLVAFNLDSESNEVDLSHLKSVPSELSIVANTSVNAQPNLDASTKKYSQAIHVNGKSVVVLQFVPSDDK